MELNHEFQQTDLGRIPSDWTVKPLGDIGEALIGLTYAPSDVAHDGILVLRSSNVQDGRLRFDDNVFVKKAVPERIMVKEGDILICVRNGSRNLIGKAALLDEKAKGMTFGAFMAVFRTSFSRFVYHQLTSDLVKRQIHQHLGATINQITNKSLNSFRVPFPENEHERESIAAALWDVDALLGALDRLIAKKRDLKQAAMQQLLTGQTRLPGFSGNWETMRFSDVVTRVNAKAYQIQTTDYQPTGSLPVVDQGQDFIVGFSDRIDKRFRCPSGGVIVFGDHTCIVKFVDFDFVVGADGTQILAARAGHSARFQAFHLAHKGIAPTGYNRHFKFVKEREFAAPPLTEQDAIAAVLFDMQTEIRALEQRRDKTRLLKQGMMQELLTGRTRLV